MPYYLLALRSDSMTSSTRTVFTFTLLALGMTISFANAQDAFVPCRRFLHQIECVTVPLATSGDDADAKQFVAPSNGLGKIYLIRPGTMEPKQKTEIFLDGKWVANLAPMTYLVMETNAGMHTIGSNRQAASSLSLNVAGDKDTYVKEQLYQLFNSEKIVFEIVDQHAGQADVLNSKLISMVPATRVDQPSRP